MTDVQAAVLAAAHLRAGRVADALEILEVWFGGSPENAPEIVEFAA